MSYTYQGLRDKHAAERQAHDKTRAELAALENRINQVIFKCRRHEHPGVSLGVHEFAASVRRMLESD
jgi:hypothetical protein